MSLRFGTWPIRIRDRQNAGVGGERDSESRIACEKWRIDREINAAELSATSEVIAECKIIATEIVASKIVGLLCFTGAHLRDIGYSRNNIRLYLRNVIATRTRARGI